MTNPVETKVVAATGAAAAGSALSAFVVWLLGVVVWGAPSDSGHADDAVLAVPTPVSVIVALAIVSAVTWLGGYLARHTVRDEGAGLVQVLVVIALVLVILFLGSLMFDVSFHGRH